MYYIGIDLGGTTIKGGLVSEDGKIITTVVEKTGATRSGEEIIKSMADVALALIEKENLKVEDIHSIGIGAPGLIDSENKVIVTSSNINFDNINVEKEMQKHINLPIFLENDANCAGIAEYVCGSMQGYKNAIMLTIGTGVGGTVILDGKIAKGSFLGEGELGHIIVDYSSGKVCGCGQVGCLEAFCSATAVINYAKELLSENTNSKILELSNGIENIDAKAVFDAYDMGDEIAIKVIDRFNEYLSIGIVSFINIFRPGIISIGGAVSKRGYKLTEPIEKRAKEMIYGDGFGTKIVPATLGNDAGIIGAAMIARL